MDRLKVVITFDAVTSIPGRRELRVDNFNELIQLNPFFAKINVSALVYR